MNRLPNLETLLLFILPVAASSQQPAELLHRIIESSKPVIGRIDLKTSDTALAAAFAWARRQALSSAFSGDPVGDWYEAAARPSSFLHARCFAPGARRAYAGARGPHPKHAAQFRGEHLRIKDWCSYWEINRDSVPAPEDYLDDAHFNTRLLRMRMEAWVEVTATGKFNCC